MTMWFATVALIVSFVLGLLAALPVAEAQQPGKVHRVGNLGTGFPGPHQQPFAEAFRQGLRDVGWVDDQHIVIEDRYAEGREERLPKLVAALIGLQVDVIFARGPRALAAAQQATTTIPIVAIDLESDPVALGFIASLARPSGNITGVFLDLPEFSAKQLELLKEVVPELSRVAILGDPAINGAQFRAIKAAAQSLGVQLQALEVQDPSEFASAFHAATRGGARALLVLQSPLVFRNRARIVELAARHGLPALAFFKEFAEAGGLMAYGSNQRDLYRRCGVYVGKILQGAKPETLPVERPMKFDLIINRKTAEALGLTIPPTFLFLADEVIQ